MFIDQKTTEHHQLDDQLTSHAVMQQRLDCAWCLAEQGMHPDEGSHGICRQHTVQLLQAWREHRAHRHPQD